MIDEPQKWDWDDEESVESGDDRDENSRGIFEGEELGESSMDTWEEFSGMSHIPTLVQISEINIKLGDL